MDCSLVPSRACARRWITSWATERRSRRARAWSFRYRGSGRFLTLRVAISGPPLVLHYGGPPGPGQCQRRREPRSGHDRRALYRQLLDHARGFSRVMDGASLNTSDTRTRMPAPPLRQAARRGGLPALVAARYPQSMRIATWNVNSLKARLEKVTWWLERARPDVLLMQETKLADADM